MGPWKAQNSLRTAPEASGNQQQIEKSDSYLYRVPWAHYKKEPRKGLDEDLKSPLPMHHIVFSFVVHGIAHLVVQR